jgi:hypothetical protein
LRAFKSDVVLGTRVKQSDIIGYVGMTGLASGNHLHYEMLRSGRQIDPLAVDLPAGDPVPADDRDRWRTEMTSRMSLLESIPRAGPVRTRIAVAAPESDESAEPVEEGDRAAGADRTATRDAPSGGSR